MMNHDHGIAQDDEHEITRRLDAWDEYLAQFWRRVPAPRCDFRHLCSANMVRATDLAGRT